MSFLFSDITIAYNNKDGLTRTLDSFFAQDFDDFEVIVVDGGSTDGSKELLEKYSDKFKNRGINFTYISEKDTGIYNAMNKGIKMSSGEWLLFMNSGDELCDSLVLHQASQMISNQSADIVYGDYCRVYDNKKVYCVSSDKLKKIRKSLPFSHQSVFTKRELFSPRPYDESLKISGDYEWFLNAYLEGKSFAHISLFVCDFYVDGISAYEKYAIYLEAEKIRISHEVADPRIVRMLKRIAWKLIDFAVKL